MPRFIILALFALIAAKPAVAEEFNIAVAANFTSAVQEIAQAFEEETGHKAALSFGSTGKLYTQIAHGAPFDVFLGADVARPERTITEGYGVAGSDFTYALGALALYSTKADLVDDQGEVLNHPDRFNKVAIGNPETAPYGKAAVEAMQALGVYEALEPQLVRGDNISQTFQFVITGNADLGFVAESQLVGTEGGSRWAVPGHLYEPIAQGAVLLKHGAENPAAQTFMDYLRGDRARTIIESYGYRLPS